MSGKIKKEIAMLAAASLALLLAGCGMVVETGKVKILKSSLESGSFAAEEADMAAPEAYFEAETEVETQSGGREQEDSVPTEGMSGEDVAEFVEQGILPEESITEQEGEIHYDNAAIESALQSYEQNVLIYTETTGGRNAMVRVQNNNDFTLPRLNVIVTVGDSEASAEFYQVPPGRMIFIPIVKEEGDLPPAVSARAKISLEENGYVDISDSIAAEPRMEEGALVLSVANQSDAAAERLNFTVYIAQGDEIRFAATAADAQGLLPGYSQEIVIPLPPYIAEEDLAGGTVAVTVNEAAAKS